MGPCDLKEGVAGSEVDVWPERGVASSKWDRVVTKGRDRFRGDCFRKGSGFGSKGTVWPQGGLAGLERDVWLQGTWPGARVLCGRKGGVAKSEENVARKVA